MERINILICCSGSVASLKVPEIAVELSKNRSIDFRIICSKKSLHFLNKSSIYSNIIWKKFIDIGGMNLIFHDEDEWNIWNKIGDPVLHIELSLWADIIIISPASADLISKINSGISDTLLLCVIRAWDFNKPCFLCPAMNTMMWDNPITGMCWLVGMCIYVFLCLCICMSVCMGIRSYMYVYIHVFLHIYVYTYLFV